MSVKTLCDICGWGDAEHTLTRQPLSGGSPERLDLCGFHWSKLRALIVDLKAERQVSR